jgi:hypothetical protein
LKKAMQDSRFIATQNRSEYWSDRRASLFPWIVRDVQTQVMRSLRLVSWNQMTIIQGANGLTGVI